MQKRLNILKLWKFNILTNDNRTNIFYFNQGWNTQLKICYRFIIYCFNISFSLLVLEAMEKEEEV